MVDAGTALAVISEQDGAHNYKIATNAAHLCGQIVKATAQNIKGRKHVRVEGWLAIAAAHGCLVSIRDVRQIDGGIQAIAELRRISDQALLATAEGFVGDDEPMWAARPMYARRAMAQTRASSRVCRSAFAHVVVLIDAKLGTTPAEEMGHDDEPAPMADIKAEVASMNGGETRSTYEVAHADKSSGRLTAELWASQVLGILKMPGFDNLAFKDWKLQPCTNKGTKTNGDKLGELREKHPDLADKIDQAADELPLAAA